LLLQAGLNVLFLVGMKLGVSSIFISAIIAQGLFGVLTTVLMVRRTRWGLSGRIAIDLWRFGLPLIATQGAVFVMTLGGRFVLQRQAGLAEVGLYALATTFGTLLVQFGNAPFMLAWESARFALGAHKEQHPAHARAFVSLNVLLLLAAVAIGVFVRDFLSVAADRAYGPAAIIVPFVLCAYVLQCWSMALDTGIMLTERTGFVAVANWAAAGVSVAGFYLFVPMWGAVGAALATLVAFFVRFALIYTFSQRLWHIQYRWGPVIALFVAAAIVIGIAALLPSMPFVLSVAVHVVLAGAFCAFGWFGPVLHDDERESIANVARSLLRKVTRFLPVRTAPSVS
jgi:O-antigen/teichoic acid export membrane protein